MIQLEKDYVKLIVHEEVVSEKQMLIEKLKQEMSKREVESRHELSQRLKALEERINEEHSYIVKSLKSNFFICNKHNR